MADTKLRIYLVDDHKIFVNGVASLLGDEADFSISGCAYSAADALNFLRENGIDILLTDIQMPGMSGIELTKKVKEDYPGIFVIGLSMFDRPEIIRELIDAGGDGYLLKDIEKDELVNAIREVAAGNTHYSSSVAEVLMKSLTEKDLLTKREKEIIGLIAAENTNVQIAEKLFISEHTVEAHRKNIFRKTKAKSIVGLVKYAYENKLI